jgi:hypothetical protein
MNKSTGGRLGNCWQQTSNHQSWLSC